MEGARLVASLLFACAGATALQPAVIRHHVTHRHPRLICQDGGYTEAQAAEIEALRRKVEALRREHEDQQVARGLSWVEERTKKEAAGSKVPTYTQSGEVPTGFDAAPIERLITRRVVARLKRHYSEADRLQRRMKRMGVRLDDNKRTWSLRPGWQEKQQALALEDESVGRQQLELESDLDGRIRRFFDYLDQDGNGCIDRKEFRLAMQVLAVPGSAIEYDATFDKWDDDGNGTLNFAEIRGALLALQCSQPDRLDAASDTVSLLADD